MCTVTESLFKVWPWKEISLSLLSLYRPLDTPLSSFPVFFHLFYTGFPDTRYRTNESPRERERFPFFRLIVSWLRFILFIEQPRSAYVFEGSFRGVNAELQMVNFSLRREKNEIRHAFIIHHTRAHSAKKSCDEIR